MNETQRLKIVSDFEEMVLEKKRRYNRGFLKAFLLVLFVSLVLYNLNYHDGLIIDAIHLICVYLLGIWLFLCWWN